MSILPPSQVAMRAARHPSVCHDGVSVLQPPVPPCSDALQVSDLCIGDGPLQLADRLFQSRLQAALGVDQKAVVECLRGCGGAHNEAVWLLKTHGTEMILKFVKSSGLLPGMPAEAENLIKLSKAHPAIVNDPCLAFPLRIVRLLGRRGDHRYDLLVMKKAAGESLCNVVQKKWRCGGMAEVLDVLAKVATCLAEFHARYGGKQHCDLNASNVLYDAASGRVTFIDLGGMGLPGSEPDVNYMARAVALSVRLVNPEMENQCVRHFRQSYQQAKTGCLPTTAEMLPRSPPRSSSPPEVARSALSPRQAPPAMHNQKSERALFGASSVGTRSSQSVTLQVATPRLVTPRPVLLGRKPLLTPKCSLISKVGILATPRTVRSR